MSASAPHAIWKGAISFGLVHVPVALHSATRNDDIDFELLDQRTQEPIGYRRVNKVSGEEVPKDEIVRGFQYEKGRYVVVSDREIAAANNDATRSIDIHAFVKTGDLSFLQLDTPYYLAPTEEGRKVYALLRETLKRTGRIGIATVVIHSRQRLAALIADGPVLVLNTLRWATELRTPERLELPPEDAAAAGLWPAEMEMAEALVDEMTRPWRPEAWRDTFRDDLMALIDRKVRTGAPLELDAPAPEPDGDEARMVDLTDLLRRSLQSRPAPSTARARSEHANADAGREAGNPPRRRGSIE